MSEPCHLPCLIVIRNQTSYASEPSVPSLSGVVRTGDAARACSAWRCLARQWNWTTKHRPGRPRPHATRPMMHCNEPSRARPAGTPYSVERCVTEAARCEVSRESGGVSVTTCVMPSSYAAEGPHRPQPRAPPWARLGAVAFTATGRRRGQTRRDAIPGLIWPMHVRRRRRRR